MLIKKKSTNTIHPRLQEVLDIVYAKRPLLEYHEKSVSSDDQVTSVSVWQDGQKVGEIDSNFRKYSPSNGCTETWFAARSPNIVKQRGHSNTKFCKDAKTLARVVIEKFTKRDLAELGENLIESVKLWVERAHESVQYKYRNSLSFSNLMLVNYFVEIYKGNSPPLPQKIKEQIETQEVLRKQENLDIATNVFTHASKNNGYAIKVMQDETLLVAHMADSRTTSKVNSTYELDQYSQEKLTMLKLLEPNQFAADIGIKCEIETSEGVYTAYFIVAGETKVE